MPVSPCQQSDPEGECCDEAGADQEPSRTIGFNPEVSIRRNKLIGNKLDLFVVYIASCFPLNKCDNPYL